MDYKLKLMQILDCIGERQGHVWDLEWRDYGVSEQDIAKIKQDFNRYYLEKLRKQREVIHSE